MYEPEKVWWGGHHKTWDSVFGTVPRLRAGRSGVRIPAGTRDFSCFQAIQTGSGADWLPRFFTGLKKAAVVI